MLPLTVLTHWGRVTHICVSKIAIIGSDNGLSPGRRQAIIWTSVGIVLIGPLGTNFNEILIEIYTFSFKKMYFKMSSGKWRPFCLCINMLAVFWNVKVVQGCCIKYDKTCSFEIIYGVLNENEKWIHRNDGISHMWTASLHFLCKHGCLENKISELFGSENKTVLDVNILTRMHNVIGFCCNNLV